MPDRKTLWFALESHYFWSDETLRKTLPEAIKWLQGHLEDVPPEHRDDSLFEVEYERGCYDAGDSCKIRIGYHREETDDEVAARLKAEAADADDYRRQREARERAQLAELQAKYGA